MSVQKSDDCFKVRRYGSDAELEKDLNRLSKEGWKVRTISYDSIIQCGSWGVVFERDKPSHGM